MFRPGPVLQVSYTGFERRCRAKHATLFNPPMLEAIRAITRDLCRTAGEIEIKHAPPNWRPATITIMSAGVGPDGQAEGRWPLAFLQIEDGVLLLGQLKAAQAELQRLERDAVEIGGGSYA